MSLDFESRLKTTLSGKEEDPRLQEYAIPVPRSLRTILLVFVLFTNGLAQEIPPFTVVAPGLEYRQVVLQQPRRILLHQLRCDPSKVRFTIALGSDLKGQPQSVRVQQLFDELPLVAALNSSYFGHQQEILGYAERSGSVLQSQVADGGVFSAFFYWDGARAGLKQRGESLPKGVPVLFQAGPRLVWDARPVEGLERKALAARSGVSLDDRGRVTLFALGGTSLTTLAELPTLLLRPYSEGGLESRRALNFDGGSSTQFMLKTKEKTALLPGIAPVPVFLGVTLRP